MVLFRGVRILVDYRPALRERTGVGEYVHELVRAYAAMPGAAGDTLRVFTSSWKDRPAAGLGHELGVNVIDRRVPVTALNYLWHRVEWPPIETLAGAADVVHSLHPLLIPTTRAAQVVTIHDLFFLSSPERTRAEIRRDYAELAPEHAKRADAIIAVSEYTARLIVEQLGVARERIHVCPGGAPRWHTLGRQPHVPRDGYVLFLGTLEPRKNVGSLLDAYERLIGRGVQVPQLVLAGGATTDAEPWLARIRRAPLETHVEHRGYIPGSEREALFAGARLLVMPSLDEGFGLPALEAMSAGIPVIASNRGSLPEVLGDAGIVVEALDVDGLAAAIERVLADDTLARDVAIRGLARAAQFSWARTAAAARLAYIDAVARRRERG